MTTVLIVEDNMPLVRLYTKVLEHLDLRVAQATNCEEAFEQLQHVTPDIILLDISLPDGNGLSIAEYAQGDPRFAHTQIIVASGDHRYDAEIKRAGIEHFLYKPVSTLALIDIVKQLRPVAAAA
jgi:two-component system CitB family response regulator